MVRWLVGVIIGGVVVVAMWPNECTRTLVGPVPGSGEPNPTSCTSLLGFPTSRFLAVLVGVVISLIVVALFSRRKR